MDKDAKELIELIKSGKAFSYAIITATDKGVFENASGKPLAVAVLSENLQDGLKQVCRNRGIDYNLLTQEAKEIVKDPDASIFYVDKDKNRSSDD